MSPAALKAAFWALNVRHQPAPRWRFERSSTCPGNHLDVKTFEIKSPDAVNVQAVYEALAHRRAATRSYVLFYIPPDRAAALKHNVEDVAAVAHTHRVGVVTAGRPPRLRHLGGA
jgi:hypothetical protein